MLHPDKARQALEERHNENWKEDKLAQLKKQPAGLRAIGNALLGHNAKGDEVEDWEKLNELRSSMGKDLDGLSRSEREKLFTVFFPHLAAMVEAAWQLQQRLPYTMGYSRKSFRAPHLASATRARRSEWLQDLVDNLTGYNPDLEWAAAWAAHLGYQADALGYLLAAAIDAGGPTAETVLDILKESAGNQHAIGGMGRHVTRALLICSRPDAWEFMEKMLLAAQRQEGLRQVILETIDEAHPQAFRRMLRLIQEHDLARFSATVRAVNVWFGFSWDSVSVKVVNETIGRVIQFLEDEDKRSAILTKGDAESAYLALWSIAYEEAPAAVEAAGKLLKDAKVERRFVAVLTLGQLGLTELTSPALLQPLDDDDLRIAVTALRALPSGNLYEDEEQAKVNQALPGLFEREEKLLARMPEKPVNSKPLVWPWMEIRLDRAEVADRLVFDRGKLPAVRLIPHMPLMSPSNRSFALAALARPKRWDAQTRATILAAVRDPSGSVRDEALKALAKGKITAEEAQQVEPLLTRKNAELRRGVLQLLLNQTDPAATNSADRLLGSSDLNQRLAGLELLRQLAAGERDGEAHRARGEVYRKERTRLNDDERAALDALAATAQKQATLDNALGLMNPAERTPVVTPVKRKVTFMTAAAAECLKSLDDLIHEHRETAIKIKTYSGEEEDMLLGEIYELPYPDFDIPMAENVTSLPLRELWEKWFADRPKKLCDPDGFELLRAFIFRGVDEDDWKEVWQKLAKGSPEGAAAVAALSGGQKPVRQRYSNTVNTVIWWLLYMHPPKGVVPFILDAAESALTLVPSEELTRAPDPNDDDNSSWRDEELFDVWLREAEACFDRWASSLWKDADHKRLWQLHRWYDEPMPEVPRNRPDFTDILLPAYERGHATDADIFDHLLGPRESNPYYGTRFDSLQTLSASSPPQKKGISSQIGTSDDDGDDDDSGCVALLHQDSPRGQALRNILDRCRERILEIELSRGELPTPATDAALSLQSLYGLDTLVRLLQALGDKPFTRGGRWGESAQGKADVLTHLISVTQPNEADTPDVFGTRVQPLIETQGNEWLIALAFVAPQWLTHVQHTLGWPGLDEAIYWYFAHSGCNKSPDKLIRERTSLTDEERAEGAVDVAWFHKTHEALGAKRWQALEAVAKYASDDNSYKKALLLTQVLLGKAKKKELIDGIKKKNLRESVRLLGLLPLATGAEREPDVEGRYLVLHEYLHYARKLGAMSRESAVRATGIGMENLARTAGYPDPVRLEWAMEARFLADLARGPVRHTVNGVTVSLALDPLGKPEVTAEKGGKLIKSIPAEVRKNKTIAELNERKTELKRQAARMRVSLEQAMCRGDQFTGAELQQLFGNPMLAPTLERLVLLGEGIAGYPVKGGKALENYQGKLEPVKKTESFRLAHPHDLLQTDAWHYWQADCFKRERVQPFKQVFRELYVVTTAEKRDKTKSQRYAGQQVNPTQAMALLSGRGWHTREGVSRTFHEVGLTASVWFKSGVTTPLEVEGLTLDQVQFQRRGEWKPLPLVEVPPRIFSEVMRDLDLVVSVAHRGGVDPEASASTVEMRASLLRETCTLLGVGNVRLKEPHVLIDGTLAKYTVHLGSGVVHRMPGGALCIVPVHAQHRGRLFLPFADDDPRTGEVLSKVLLLARDNEIQDPTILDQIRARP